MPGRTGAGDAALRQQRLEAGEEGRRGQPGGAHAAQALALDAGFVGKGLVVCGQTGQHGLAERRPRGRREHASAGLARQVVRLRQQGLPAPLGQVVRGGELVELEPERRARDQARKALGRIGSFEDGEQREAVRAPTVTRGREGVEDAAAAQGLAARGVADDDAVAAAGEHRAVEHRLHQRRGARGEPAGLQCVVQQHQACHCVTAGVVQGDARPLAELARRIRQQFQAQVEAVGRAREGGVEQPVAALDLAEVDATEVDRAAAARAGGVCLAVVCAQAAHAHLAAKTLGARQQQGVADVDAAAAHRAGDDRAGAGEREAAVGDEAESRVRWAGIFFLGDREQVGAQRIDAGAGDRRDRKDRAAGEGGRCQQGRDIGLHLGNTSRLDAVALGERHRAACDAEQVKDGEVLASLWHHAVVGCNDQQRVVDAGGAHQHGRHEALVAGHVDEAEGARGGGRVATGRIAVDRRKRIAELDGDAARLLLGQVGGVHAGERADQRGLAMVDVAGGADQHAGALSWFSGRRCAPRERAARVGPRGGIRRPRAGSAGPATGRCRRCGRSPALADRAAPSRAG